MSRQQRRAEERAQAKRESKRAFIDRVHGEVVAGETVLDLWLVYYRNRFERVATPALEPEHVALLKEVFYAGVSSMFQLMTVASDVGDSEDEIDRGAQRMQRLYEELDAYVKGLK